MRRNRLAALLLPLLLVFGLGASSCGPTDVMLQNLRLVNYYPKDHGWSKMWTEFDPPELSRDFTAMRAMGANSVRIIMQAYVLGFPQPSPTMLQHVRDIIGLADDAGLTVQLSLFDWFGDWANIAGSKQWAHAILDPYRGDARLSFVEVRNELDVNDPAALQWAKTMAPVVQAASGKPTTISLAGNAPAGSLQKLKDTIPLDFYDVHDYGSVTAQLANDQAIVSPSPLYVGEAGHSTGPGGSPSDPTLEQQQADFFRTLNAKTRELGLPLASPWAWQDFVDGSLTWVPTNSNEYHFGLLRVNGTPKPAYAVEKAAFGGA